MAGTGPPRRPDHADPQGRSPVDTAAAQHLANERRILSGLTAAEQRQLAGLLRKLSLTLPPQEKTSPRPAPANRTPPLMTANRTRPPAHHEPHAPRRP